MPPREGDAELALGFAVAREARAVETAYAMVRTHVKPPPDAALTRELVEVLEPDEAAERVGTARVLGRLVAVLNDQLDRPRLHPDGAAHGEEVLAASVRLAYPGNRDRLLIAREMPPGLLGAAVRALAVWAALCAATVFGDRAAELIDHLPTWPDVADLIGAVCSREIQDDVRRYFQ